MLAERSETFIMTMHTYHYLGITDTVMTCLHASYCSTDFWVVSK
jgi:hypothetical protein